jgi:hypothetical protein
MHRTTRIALSSALLFSLAACVGGGGGQPETGTLSLAVTDAPIDNGITKVNVRFTGVEVKPENGPSILFDFGEGNEKDIDLLQLQGEGNADLIIDEEVPAGRYQWARLHVLAEKDIYDSWIEKHGSEMYPLFIPSGAQSGLKLVSGFVVPAGGSAAFVIDWNLAKAIHAPEGQDPNHYLRPALRITDRAESGVIRGTVAAGLIDENNPDNCAGGNRVYLFDKPADEDALLDDIDEELDDGRADPLTTAKVEYDVDSDEWRWVIGYVAPGDYTVAFTCSAMADEPLENDYPDIPDSAFDFAARDDVTVVAQETSPVIL